MYTIYLFTCLCMLTELATIIEFFVIRSSAFGYKNFSPFTPFRCLGWAQRNVLFRICKDFSSFSLWFKCISNVIPKFFLEQFFPVSCVCNSAAFSFSMVFFWYCEFMIHPKTFNLTWYFTALLLCPKGNTICSTFHLLKIEQRQLPLVLHLQEFFTTASEPIKSLILFCIFSVIFSRFCSLVFYFLKEIVLCFNRVHMDAAWKLLLLSLPRR